MDIKDYSIGWGTLALINAGLAQGKNRSGANWFLLSLFLGPFATLFLVISSKVTTRIHEDNYDDSDNDEEEYGDEEKTV